MRGWIEMVVLVVLLAVTSASIVASSFWLLESHRDLKEMEQKRMELMEEERALAVEWVFRTDLNNVERRARQELGMKPPRADQWWVLEK